MTEHDSKRPVARPVGSSDQSASPLDSDHIERISAPDINDGPGPSYSHARRSTKAGMAHAEESLTAGDWELLRSVHTFRLLTGDQLQRLFHDGSQAGGRASRRQLLRLSKLDVLARLDRRIGGVRGGSAGYIYSSGLAGQRLLNVGSRPRRHKEPGWPFLRHTLSISELYVQTIELTRDSGDAELLRFDPEPHAWRSQAQLGEELHLRPDAFVILDRGEARQLWFIEIDLGTESRPVIRKKMAQYLTWLETGHEQQQLGAFPRVLWHTPDDHRRAHLQQLAEEAAGPAGLHTTTGLLDGLGQIKEPP